MVRSSKLFSSIFFFFFFLVDKLGTIGNEMEGKEGDSIDL